MAVYYLEYTHSYQRFAKLSRLITDKKIAKNLVTFYQKIIRFY